MEERRIERISEAMRLSAEAERKVLPVTSRCLDAMVDAAESIQPRKVKLHFHSSTFRRWCASFYLYARLCESQITGLDKDSDEKLHSHF